MRGSQSLSQAVATLQATHEWKVVMEGLAEWDTDLTEKLVHTNDPNKALVLIGMTRSVSELRRTLVNAPKLLNQYRK